ncbi:MAG: transglycosylase SLT domain-containing protein [Nitrospirae bacterium]|nr:transglycosylase SLT domain-containing protein [Nitrospirota bacterium]
MYTSRALSLVMVLILFSGCQVLKPASVPLPLPRPDDSPALQNEIETKEFLQCGMSEECFYKGREAEMAGKRDDAKGYLKIILNRNEGDIWSRRASYLTARWEIEGKILTDEKRLHDLQKNYPEIQDYVEKLMADAAFARGDFEKADKIGNHILLVYPDTVLRPAILAQKGEALRQLKEWDQATEMFTLFLRENPRDEKSAEILLKLFELNSEREDWSGAGNFFRDLETKYPDTPWSLDAEKKVSKLSLARPDRNHFDLSNHELFHQGKVLYEIGKFEKALDIWKKLERKSDRNELYLPELELKMGLAFLPLKKYPDASDHFKRVIRKHGHSEFAPEALLGLARIAIREENENDLLSLLREGEKLFPRQEGLYKLIYLIGSYYEEHRQISGAHSYYQMIIRDLPQNSVVPDALWRDGWISYKEGDNVSAEKTFSKLIEQYPASPLHAQGLYWKGRAIERGGNPEEAQAEFKGLCQDFSHSYYCHLARKRVAPEAEALTSLPEPQPLASEVAGSFQKDDHYQRARELMILNLNQDASKEFNFLADRYHDKPSLLQLDKELIQAGDFFHALKILRGQFPDVLDRGRSFDFPLLWELAYPKEVVEQIQKIAIGIKIEPEFVAGIMREESVFDVRATSRSGAMGLMQLMPFTGEWVAQQLGVASFVREKLYDQELNTRFGAFYLDHLSQKFQGNLIYTAASYNAGPEAVTKWIVNGNYTDLEEFVENIPYQETRYYVKRVIKSYEEFKEVRSRINESPKWPLLDKFMLNR